MRAEGKQTLHDIVVSVFQAAISVADFHNTIASVVLPAARSWYNFENHRSTPGPNAGRDTPVPPRAARPHYPEQYSTSLPEHSGSPGCCWSGRGQLHSCKQSLYRGCTAACNAPYSCVKEALAGRLSLTQENFRSV